MSKEAPTRLVLDPNGDVVFRLQRMNTAGANSNAAEGTAVGSASSSTSCGSDGGGVVEVVVSTNILTLVSPVFKAMLAGPFRESIELAAAIRNGAANGPYTIDLPEDNADAMCLLMEAFHFRTTATTTNAPTPAMLETLAFLCDKYQCAKALNLTTAFWISAALQGLRGECLGTTPTGSSSATVKDGCLAKYMDGCWRLVVFAYVVDLPETFSQLCWEIIRHHVGPITDIPVTSRYSAKTGGSVQPVMVLNDHPLIRGCLASTCQSRHSHFEHPTCVAYFEWCTSVPRRPADENGAASPTGAKRAVPLALVLGAPHVVLPLRAEDAWLLREGVDRSRVAAADELRSTCNEPPDAVQPDTEVPRWRARQQLC